MLRSKILNPKYYYFIILLLLIYGCTKDEITTKNLTIEANNAIPSACFTYSSATNNFKAGLPIQFTSCSANAQSYYWEFSDGYTTKEQNPVHVFKEKGIYTVRLSILNLSGIDSLSMEVPIDCQFENYIIYRNISYKLEQANLLSSKFHAKYRHCIQLWNSDISFSLDRILGKGNAVKIIIDGELVNGNNIASAGSLAIPSFSNTYSDQQINLEEQNIEIETKNDSIKISLKTDHFELFYHDSYNTGHYYNHPTINEIEELVRRSQDQRATFTTEQYETLLDELTNEKYLSLTINEMLTTYDETKVIVGLRHDIDCHPFKALKMAQMEHSRGLKASYYVLATSLYYGEFYPDSVRRNRALDTVYQQIYHLGGEIGIHNDLLTVMISKKLDPFEFNWKEIYYYNSINIPIYGNVGHGSTIASQTVHNSQMFSDFAESSSITYAGQEYPIGSYSMQEYGFSYEANFFHFNQYYSESGGKWSVDGGFSEVISRLQNSKPGQRIQILTHPVWWLK